MVIKSLIREINNLFKKHRSRSSVFLSIRHNQDLFSKIKESTNYLSVNATLPERIYCLLNNIEGSSLCKICNKLVKFRKFTYGYNKYCGSKCLSNDKDVQKKRKQSRNEISIVKKRNATCFERYGVENVFEDKKRIEKAVKKKYGSYRNKLKQTCLNKYGVENANYVPGVMGRKKQNSLNKYGVENPTQLPEVQQKRKETNLKRYGVDIVSKLPEVKERIIKNGKLTNLKRYGVDNPSKVEIFKEKKKQTCVQNHGVDNPLKSYLVREKGKQTWMKKYGVDNPNKSKEVQERVKKINLKKYGVDNYAKSEEFKNGHLKRYYKNLFLSDRLKDKVRPLFDLKEFKGALHQYKFQCLECNKIFKGSLRDGKIPRCLNCNPYISGKSKYEEDITLWLKTIGIRNIIRNNRSLIRPKELDIYLPSYKLAIEFNGLWSHSEINGKKDKNYHLNKTNLCEKKGIQLVHIFEDEWIYKQDIVKSIIKNKLGLIKDKIYARECIIRAVSYKEANIFLLNNHLQGSVRGVIYLGLYTKVNNSLVYLIIVGKSRMNVNYKYELYRACSKKNIVVIGGFNKLITYVRKNLCDDKIITYVDKRYFNGKSYKEWVSLQESPPKYYYTKDFDKLAYRTKFKKKSLQNLFPDIYLDELTEWQIMQLAGYDRVWDCGNLVYVLDCKRQ